MPTTDKRKEDASPQKATNRPPKKDNKKQANPVTTLDPKENSVMLPKFFLRDNWGVIANLIVTIIVGVVVAIYLQNQQERFEHDQQSRTQQFQATQQAQNEELQRQLLQSQNQMQFANIDILHKDFVEKGYTQDAITIRNQGPATAENLRVAICIQDIHISWSEHITDISQLQIALADTAVNSHQETIVTNCRYKLADGKPNAALITIDTLPPNEEINIDIGGPEEVQTWGYGTQVQVFMVFLNSQFDTHQLKLIEEDNSYADAALRNFMKDKFYVARLRIDAACKNCVINEQQNTLAITGFSAMSGYSNAPSEFKLFDKTSQYLELTTNVSVIYTRPTSGEPIGDLIIYLNGIGEPLQFNEIEKFEFDSIPNNFTDSDTSMRIRFDPGSTTAARVGILDPNDSVQFIVTATQGQMMTVTLTARPNELTLGVYNPDGLALKHPDSNYNWSTNITTIGDYTINLASPSATQTLSYTLQLSLTTP